MSVDEPEMSTLVTWTQGKTENLQVSFKVLENDFTLNCTPRVKNVAADKVMLLTKT